MKHKTLKQIQDDFQKEFGAFAIMGKAGRLYNGAFANEARIHEAQDFIKKAIKDALIACRVENYPEEKDEVLGNYGVGWSCNTTQYDENVKSYLGEK